MNKEERRKGGLDTSKRTVVLYSVARKEKQNKKLKKNTKNK